MAKYVVHKKSFFFTDEDLLELPEEEVKGSVISIFDNLEEAKIEKEKQDILSIQNLANANVNQFINGLVREEEVYEKFYKFYALELNTIIKAGDYFDFPDTISKELAEKFLEILPLRFHNIMEYDDDEDPNDFEKFDLLEF